MCVALADKLPLVLSIICYNMIYLLKATVYHCLRFCVYPSDLAVRGFSIRVSTLGLGSEIACRVSPCYVSVMAWANMSD